VANGVITTGFILSIGYFSSTWGIKLPLFYIANKIPFIAAIRATQRYSLLLYFGVLILSGYGIQAVMTKVSRQLGLALVSLLSLFFLLEVYPSKLPFNPPTSAYKPSTLDNKIAELQSLETTKLIVLHYPIYTAMPGYPIQESTYMVDSTLHWANILNGFSGAEPLGFKADMQTLNTLPSSESIELLKKYSVNILAIHAPVTEQRRNEIKDFFEISKLGSILEVDKDQYLVVLNRE